MVITIAITAFVIIFTLTSSKTLYSQLQYQNKVVNAKQHSLDELKADVTAEKQLIGSYSTFVKTNQNVIGGSLTGNGQNAGDNGKIVLDALPSQYDYPALTSSVQYLLGLSGNNIDSIAGVDEQASQSGGSAAASAAAEATTATPTTAAALPGAAIAMPFQFSVDGPYSNIQNLFLIFEHSIRPVPIQTITITGDQTDLNLTATAQSYYQPEKAFSITTEAIQ
jgi:hypothetical protein